jgi:hypothetical protein
MDLLTLPRTALASSLGAATAVRGSRVFHPKGSTFAARLTVAPTTTWGARVLDEPAEHEGVVRLSRAVGLPHPLPDAEGLALRLPCLGMGGAPLDLLVNSAWRFVFAPAVLSPVWSAILPHRTPQGLVLLGARPLGDARTDGFEMLAAQPLGAWQTWGELLLGEPLDGEELRFEPTLGADDLQPVQLFRALRARAYERSQAHRD